MLVDFLSSGQCPVMFCNLLLIFGNSLLFSQKDMLFYVFVGSLVIGRLNYDL